MKSASSTDTAKDFLCLNALDPIDYPCAKQCADCQAIEERERSGIPPEDKDGK